MDYITVLLLLLMFVQHTEKYHCKGTLKYLFLLLCVVYLENSQVDFGTILLLYGERINTGELLPCRGMDFIPTYISKGK